MTIATNLGFPRIGAKRELKKALESFWKGEISESALHSAATEIKRKNWALQHQAGIAHIPSNDFSYYDHVLDTVTAVGAIPTRYGWKGGPVDLQTYFTMARGSKDIPAMEMLKWFDTNYHYIVPEFTPETSFSLASLKAVEEFNEAKSQGIHTRPVLLGPVSFLLLGKMKKEGASSLTLLPKLLPVYGELLKKLKEAGADWVQIDEPCLVLDLTPEAKKAYKTAYDALAKAAPGLHLLLTTYFGDLRDNLEVALSLPVAGLHIDLARAPEQLDAVLANFPKKTALSLGLVNGRNVWRTNLEEAYRLVEKAAAVLGPEHVLVAPSCSLLLSPVDLSLETELDEELKSWLAFAAQKLGEISLLAKTLSHGREYSKAEFAHSSEAAKARIASARIHNPAVKDRVANITPDMLKRQQPFTLRRTAQEELGIPALATTTIGSFPQTAEIRKARADHKSGKLTDKDYEHFLEEKTRECIRIQEEIGLDVLVHGEFERNDMVEYFGEQLAGFAFTKNGWVQSYGSRCVKPPIIFGDVSRPEPMTVRWSTFAQSLTEKPMKGMLTGPVTILQWSFVRDDQPRSDTCKQIALAIRDEVADLEKAGISIIQIDEPAIREGLPLRKADWKAYLTWAVECFRLASSGVKDSTQIHTHMCYSEFNDIIQAVADMDADVISIETSRSQMKLLDAFTRFRYPNQIGPGVYDIHSPRVPSPQEVELLLREALGVLSHEQMWINPDCGLKTRGWKEVKPALVGMVAAARKLRREFGVEEKRKAG